MNATLKLYIKIVLLLLSLSIIIPFLIGYKPYTVLTNSMSPSIPKWSVAISKNENSHQIKRGDILFFNYQNNARPVMHRVNAIQHTSDGLAFEMKGDANKKADFILVPEEKVYGKYIYHIPLIGYFIHLIQPFLVYAIISVACLILWIFIKKKHS